MAPIPKLPAPEDDEPLLSKVLYAGENSATADKDALARAKAMKEQGADDATVWRATGWYLGPEGKWRSEISDEKAKLRDGVEQQLKDQLAAGGHKTYRLRDLLEHDDLANAYPSVPDMQVSVYPHPMLGADVLGKYQAGFKPAEDDPPQLRALFALRPDFGSPTITVNLKGASEQADVSKTSLGEAVRQILLHEIQHH